jgi:hypothetical protein
VTLIVETGVGILNADSLASVAEADNFWSGRGAAGTTWMALTVPLKEAALRDASDYVSAGLRSGRPLSDLQSFSWPWDGVDLLARDRATVARATILAADVARLGPLTSGAARGGRVLSESKTLGPLSKATSYSDRDTGSSANGRDLSFVDSLIASLSGTGGGLIIGRTARA